MAELVLDAPRAEVRSGLDRVSKLTPGTGFAEFTAVVAKPWGSAVEAALRAELGWRPTDAMTAFAFAQLGIHDVQAGVGARVTFG